jgi:hypothetical protein
VRARARAIQTSTQAEKFCSPHSGWGVCAQHSQGEHGRCNSCDISLAHDTRFVENPTHYRREADRALLSSSKVRDQTMAVDCAGNDAPFNREGGIKAARFEKIRAVMLGISVLALLFFALAARRTRDTTGHVRVNQIGCCFSPGGLRGACGESIRKVDFFLRRTRESLALQRVRISTSSFFTRAQV